MTPRKFDAPRLVIASHNAGKAREIAELLAPHGVEIISAAALNLPEPEETATTFVGNAGTYHSVVRVDPGSNES